MSAEKFKVFVENPVADSTLEKPWTSGEISDKAGLMALAKKLNPVVGYWGEQPTLALAPARAALSISIARLTGVARSVVAQTR